MRNKNIFYFLKVYTILLSEFCSTFEKLKKKEHGYNGLNNYVSTNVKFKAPGWFQN